MQDRITWNRVEFKMTFQSNHEIALAFVLLAFLIGSEKKEE